MKRDILKISIWDRATVSVKFCEDWHEIVWQFPWRIDLYGAFFILSKQMAKNGLASYWEITEGLQRARKSGPLGGSGGTNGEPVRIIRGSPSHITSHWSLRNWIRKRKQMHFGIQRESPSVAVISDPQYEPTNEQMIRYCSEWLHRQTEDQIRTECVFYHLRWAARSFWTLYITYRFSQTPYRTGSGKLTRSCQYSISKLRGAVQKNLCKTLRPLFVSFVHKLWAAEPWQGTSSHYQRVIWVLASDTAFVNSTNISTNTEMAMLSSGKSQ